MSDEAIREVLTKYRVVAVVGLSRDPTKASYSVAEYLKNHGFHIVPVNPTTDEVLGEKSHRSLLDLPNELRNAIEIVEIFRPSADVPSIVEQVVQLKRLYDRPFVVWMQMGIANEEAAMKAREEGLTVIMDRCMMREHKRLLGDSVQ